NDVWAVGFDGNGTLTEHWNGTKWQVVLTPKVGTKDVLAGVTAISPGDIWAVGYSYIHENGSDRQTLALHWDGNSWQIVPTPNVAVTANELRGVAAVSTADVWAVGMSDDSNPEALIEHWDGVEWTA